MRRVLPALAVVSLALALSGCGIRAAHQGTPATPAAPEPVSTSESSTDPLAGIDADLDAINGATQQATQDLDAGNDAAGKSDDG